MSTNFVANLDDLDAIFAPYTSGAKADVTLLYVGGQDLKDRYQKYTSGTKADITYFTPAGTDLKDIFAPIGGGPLTITADPNPATGFSSPGPGSASTGTNTTTTGGTGPYTYLWTRVSGTTAIVLISSPTAEDAAWEFTSTSIAAIRLAIWRCTVTDSLGATAYVDVQVSLQVGGEPP